jgi:hypothetical protein
MDTNAAQENPVPENSEKEHLRGKIISLSKNVSESFKSVRIVGGLLVVAALAYIFAGMVGLGSPFVFPTLIVLLVGNQVYLGVTKHNQKKLEKLRTTYESRFGVFTS